MTGPTIDPAAVTAAYAAQQAATRQTLLAFLAALWSRLTAYRSADAEAFAAQAAPVVTGAQQRTAALTATYLSRLIVAGTGTAPSPVAGLGAISDLAVRGVPAKEVYQRPFRQIWWDLSQGRPLDAAVSSAGARLQSLAATDVQLAKTHTSRQVLDAHSKVVGYRRVLMGDYSCALCLIASTQRYRKSELLPIHPGCDCGIAPIFGDEDPGQVIDEQLLQQIHDTVGSTLGQQYVDSGARSPLDYRTVIVTHEHGELGPVLGVRGQQFTGSRDLGPDARRPAGAPGGGGPPGPPSGRRAARGAADEPRRDILPIPDRSADDEQRLAALPKPGRVAGARPYGVPTFDQLEREGRIGVGEEFWTDPDELAAARRAKALGIDAVSVRLSDENKKSPDGVILAAKATIEMKRLRRPTANAAYRNAREGRTQSRRLFITGVDAGLDRDTAWSALADIVRNYGRDLDEVLIEHVTDTGSAAIHWP